MPREVWESLDHVLGRAECVEYNERLARFNLPKNKVDKVRERVDEEYSPVNDEWVLRHHLYRWKSREEVANRLDVTTGEVEYWCEHHGVQFPWKNERTLETAYRLIDESATEVAAYLNCGAATIRKWLDKHDIKESTPNDGLEPERLHQLFVDKRLSKAEIGRRLDCSAGKVSYWLDVNGIERPERGDGTVQYMSHKGYPCWFFDQDGAKRRVRVHRLAAVAKYGFSHVSGKVVHHESGVPWDNRLSNLTLITNEEHSKYHNLNPDE